MSIVRVVSFALFALLTVVTHAQPQPVPTPKTEAPKASAVKLPDGTIVFLSKNPDDPATPIDGVVLSPQEYKALVEQAEAAKNNKPVVPSRLAIKAKWETRGERPITVFTLTYSFRTTTPKTTVTLGCQRLAISAAKNSTDKLPVLISTDEGVSAIVDQPGDHTLTLTAEDPVQTRGTKNEQFVEFGLPRAAITTIELINVPVVNLKKMTVGTHIVETGKPIDIKRVTLSIDGLLGKATAIGTSDLLELSWDQSSVKSVTPAMTRTSECDVVVRVDDTIVESVAKLKFQGTQAEWLLTLPTGAEVLIERGTTMTSPIGTIPEPSLTRPTDVNKPVWKMKPALNDPTTDWLVTVTVRQLRPKLNAAGSRGPYPIGPFLVQNATKQSGTLKVLTPPTLRIGFKTIAEIRRQDLPIMAEEDLVAMFQFGTLPTTVGTAKPATWLELDVRPAVQTIRVRPTHKFQLTASGWQLDTTLRVVPAARQELEQILVELPMGWTKRLEANSEDLVDSVQIVSEGPPRVYAVRFLTPQKSAFDLNLTAVYSVESGTKEQSIPLIRFPQAEERDVKISVSVPDGLEIRGSASLNENTSEPLKPGTPVKNRAIAQIQGDFDRRPERVELAWHPYRPDLACDNKVEITIQDRQTQIVQTLTFKPTASDHRPIRMRGPTGDVVWQQSTPPLDPVDLVQGNAWEFRPTTPPEPGKEFALVINYVLKHPSGVTQVPLTLFWPEDASRVETSVRIWGGSQRRRAQLTNVGQWREIAPEASPAREQLPWLNLATSTARTPILLEMSEGADESTTQLWVDRALLKAMVANDGSIAVRAKYQVRRWLGNRVEIELAGGHLGEVYIDGRRIDGVHIGDIEHPVYSIPLPESRVNRTVDLELRYQLRDNHEAWVTRSIVPPVLPRTAFRQPMRVYVSADSAWMVLSTQWNVEHDLRWSWRKYVVGVEASNSTTDLDTWYQTGSEPENKDVSFWSGSASDSFEIHQNQPGAITIRAVPRTTGILIVSAVVFVLGVLIFRLKLQWIGFVLAVLSIVAVVATLLNAQPSMQMISAALPGLALLGICRLILVAWKWYIQRGINNLPGFVRSRAVLESVQLAPVTQPEGVAGSRSHKPTGSAMQPDLAVGPRSSVVGG